MFSRWAPRGRACAAGAPISSQRNGGKEGPGGFAHPGPPSTGAHGGGGLYGACKNRVGIAARSIGTDATGAAAPRAARIGITPQALIAVALYQPGPPGRRRCHAAEIPGRPLWPFVGGGHLADPPFPRVSPRFRGASVRRAAHPRRTRPMGRPPRRPAPRGAPRRGNEGTPHPSGLRPSTFPPAGGEGFGRIISAPAGPAMVSRTRY